MSIKFRAYFTHIKPQVVEAKSATVARELAAEIARRNGTFVTKIKRARDQ